MRYNEYDIRVDTPVIRLQNSNMGCMSLGIHDLISHTEIELVCDQLVEKQIKDFEVFYMEVLKVLINSGRVKYASDIIGLTGVRGYLKEVARVINR